MLVGWKYYDGKKINAANVGASNAVSALLNTAVVIGFGSLVQVTPAFEVVKTAILGMEGSPVLSFALATTLLAGACASGTGGMAISLQTLAPSYLAMGVPAGVLQRIALTASCTLDSLPHNGALYSCFSVCKSDHRHAYFLTMLLSVVATTLTMIVGVVIASVWYV